MSTTSQPLFKQLIVTRPQAQGDELVAALKSVLPAEVKVYHLPLLAIEALPITNDALKLAENQLGGAIFISSNAVKFWFSGSHEAAAQLATTPLFAVGEGTAAQIEELTGRHAIFPQQMNAEGLLALPELASVDGQQWLIIKGEGGRPLLRETLLQRGALVSEVDVYRRRLPDYSVQQQHYKRQFERPVWLITSAEALSNLHRILGLMENPEHHTRVIVSSERLAEQAHSKGFTIIDQSAGAAQTQLVQCVKNLMTH